MLSADDIAAIRAYRTPGGDESLYRGNPIVDDPTLALCDALEEAWDANVRLRISTDDALAKDVRRAEKAEADLAEMTREARMSREATEKAVQRQRKSERQVAAVRALGERAKASPPNDDWYDGWAEGIAQCVAALDGTL